MTKQQQQSESQGRELKWPRVKRDNIGKRITRTY
jgi:hypothetical protein